LTFSCRAFSAAAAAIAACFNADRANVKDDDGTGGTCACRCASAECGGVAPAASAAAFFCASAAAAAARALIAEEEEEEEDRNYCEDSIRLVFFIFETAAAAASAAGWHCSSHTCQANNWQQQGVVLLNTPN
jgi:hypothetical protein